MEIPQTTDKAMESTNSQGTLSPLDSPITPIHPIPIIQILTSSLKGHLLRPSLLFPHLFLSANPFNPNSCAHQLNQTYLREFQLNPINLLNISIKLAMIKVFIINRIGSAMKAEAVLDSKEQVLQFIDLLCGLILKLLTLFKAKYKLFINPFYR